MDSPVSGPESPATASAKTIGSDTRDRDPVGRNIGEIAFVLAVTLVGGWIRLRALGRDSFWFDELISALQAHLPFWDLLREVSRDVHPPLHHLLLRGTLTFGDSEAVLRFPSAFFGTLSIPALYLLGRAWFSGPVGALAALLMALSSGHVWHSRDARMYTLLTLEGILSWYFFGKLLEGSRRAMWAGYFLSSGAILYTHYYGVLLLLPQTAPVFLFSRRGEVERSFRTRWLMVQGGLALLILPWLIFAATSVQLGRLEWIERYHPLAQIAAGLLRFTAGYPGMAWGALQDRRLPNMLALLCGLLIIGFAAAALFRDENGHPRSLRTALGERPVLLCLWYLMAPIAMMLAISLLRRLLVPRHMLMTAPAFLLLVALGLSRLLPRRMIVTTALAVVLLVPGLIARLATPRTRDYRAAAALIAGEATPGDVLLVHEEQARLLLEYYLGSRESEFRWCPRSFRDTSREATQACLDEARNVWVVSSHEPTRSEEGSHVLSVPEEQFMLVRRDGVFGTRILLHQRRPADSHE